MWSSFTCSVEFGSMFFGGNWHGRVGTSSEKVAVVCGDDGGTRSMCGLGRLVLDPGIACTCQILQDVIRMCKEEHLSLGSCSMNASPSYFVLFSLENSL